MVKSKVTSFLLLPEEGALMDRSVGFFTAAIGGELMSFYFYVLRHTDTHSSRVETFTAELELLVAALVGVLAKQR